MFSLILVIHAVSICQQAMFFVLYLQKIRLQHVYCEVKMTLLVIIRKYALFWEKSALEKYVMSLDGIVYVHFQ